MGVVFADLAISLDGFVAGPNDEDGGLHNWYFGNPEGETNANTEIIAQQIASIGAMIMGRRTYIIGADQDGFAENPYPVPHFVLSHSHPATPAKGETEFTFVSEGIEQALELAKAAAGEKDVCIGGGATVVQQYLKARLLDELHLHVVPVLLGQGIRLFEHLGITPITLEPIDTRQGPGVIHLRFKLPK